MFYRQRLLLALLESFGGKLNNRDLQKYLFLFTQRCQIEKSYDFVPYKFGCFSFQSYADRRNLAEAGFLTADDQWQLKGRGHLDAVTPDDKKKIQQFQMQYSIISSDDLVREVYRNYPYYAIKSEIASRFMTTSEMEKIEAVKPNSNDVCFFTIGYEGASFEDYLNRLIRNGIRLLCDVRKNALSRKYGFSKKTLSETLRKLNIVYIHIPELGIESDKRQELSTQSDYDKLFKQYERTTLKSNATQLEKLNSLLLEYKRVAITCFESNQCMCHRSIVAQALTKLPNWNYPTHHI